MEKITTLESGARAKNCLCCSHPAAHVLLIAPAAFSHGGTIPVRTLLCKVPYLSDLRLRPLLSAAKLF